MTALRKQLAAATIALSTLFAGAAFADAPIVTVQEDQQLLQTPGTPAERAEILDTLAPRNLNSARKLLPEILKNAESTDAAVRALSARTLGTLGWTFVQLADQSLETLVKMSADADAATRSNAVAGIAQIGGKNAKAMPIALATLTKIANDTTLDANMRQMAAQSLGDLAVINRKQTPAILATLTPLLKDTEASVRLGAANAVGNIGARYRQMHGQTAVTLLTPLTADADKEVSYWSGINIGLLCDNNRRLVCPKLP